MQTDGERGDHVMGSTGGSSGTATRGDPPLWTFGSRIATRNVEAARKAYLRYAETAERALNRVDSTTSRLSEDLWVAETMKAKVARGRAVLRDVMMRGQIAADTNMRAYLDHLDELAKAPSAGKLASAQTAYVFDQWQRSLRQAFDLQQRTVGALRKITSGAPA